MFTGTATERLLREPLRSFSRMKEDHSMTESVYPTPVTLDPEWTPDTVAV